MPGSSLVLIEAGIHHCGATFPVTGEIQESVVELALRGHCEQNHKEENGRFTGL